MENREQELIEQAKKEIKEEREYHFKAEVKSLLHTIASHQQEIVRIEGLIKVSREKLAGLKLE